MAHPGGRPSLYNLETADKICAELSIGRPLAKICLDEDMPCLTSVYKWLRENEQFAQLYTRAKEESADTLADEMMQISDDGLNDTYLDENGNKRTDQDVIARSRLRVETRKWIAAKLKPKKYGDKVTNEVTGAGGGPVEHSIQVSFVLPKK